MLCASAATQSPGFTLPVHIRIRRQELEIDCCRRDFRRLFSLAKNASVFFDHCWKSSSQPVNSFGRPARLLFARTASASPDSAGALRVNNSC